MNTPPINYQSVRYTQETFKPYFSNSRDKGMGLSETYVLLANGFLDPTSFAPMTIFEHDSRRYCIDTRRLTIAKELQRQGKQDIAKRLPIQYVKKNDQNFAEQYRNLVDKRLPAMKREGLDGSTIKLEKNSSYICCYKSNSTQFRDDLEAHIASDHLKMNISDFRKLNISQCKQCTQKFTIIIHKPANKGSYKFIQKPVCRHLEEKTVHILEKPWTDVSLKEIRDLFLQLTGRHIEKESLMLRTIPLSKSPQPWSCSHDSHLEPDEEKDPFIKKLCGFLLTFLFIITVVWLTFPYLRE